MSNPVLDPLYAVFPEIIDAMPPRFSSHEFILKLAQRHQDLYVEALYHYLSARRSGRPAPFLILHGILAQQLGRHDDVLCKVRDDLPSRDIFGNPAECAQWEKSTP